MYPFDDTYAIWLVTVDTNSTILERNLSMLGLVKRVGSRPLPGPKSPRPSSAGAGCEWGASGQGARAAGGAVGRTRGRSPPAVGAGVPAPRASACATWRDGS